MRSGFTVVELAITLAVLSVLTAVAIPRLARLLDSIHVRGAAVEIESTFGAARHIAIARGAQSVVDIDTSNRIIYVSVGGDTVRKREIGAVHDVQFSATRVRTSYAPTGMGYGAANLSVVVRRSSAADTVFVSRLGRVRH